MATEHVRRDDEHRDQGLGAHDRWFRFQVAVALEDDGEIEDPSVSSEFAERRAKARAKQP